MSRAWSFLLFMLVALSILGSVHYYLWARLVRDPELPLIWHRALSGLFVVLYLSIPATFYISATLPSGATRGLLLVSYSWLGLLFMLFVLVLGSELLRAGFAALQAFGDRPPADLERRLTLSRVLGASVALLGGGAGTLAVRTGLGELMVKQTKIPLKRLPKALAGLRIVQLTDVHVGSTIRRESSSAW